MHNNNGARKTAETAIYAALCIGGGFLVAIFMADQTIFNADTISHYLQTKLITSGVTSDPSQLSFSRLPSIFPDLATLIALTANSPNAGLGTILPRYAWAIVTLFIYLQSEFIFFTLSRTITRIQISLIVTNITLVIAAISPQFRESIGLAITPVHHGGNIACTYLLGSLLVWNSNHDYSKSHLERVKLGLVAVTVAIAIASNRLFIFNALLPALLAAKITGLAIEKKQSLSRQLNLGESNKKSIAVLALAGVAGLAATRVMNKQCSPEIVIRAANTYKELSHILNTNNYAYLAICILLIVTVMGCLKTIRESQCSPQGVQQTHQANRIKHKQLLLGGSFLLLSILSPTAYVWLLGENDLLKIRHILIIPAISWLTFTLVGAKIVEIVRSSLIKHRNFIADLAIYLALAMGTIMTARNLNIKDFSVTNAYRSSILLRTNELQNISEAIKNRGLKNGLSDFWGIIISEVFKLKNPRAPSISIEPILQDGKPDLWGHTQQQFKDANGQIKEYNFVVALNQKFENSIIKAYGQPAEIISIGQSDKSILLYNDESSMRRINHNIEVKLAKFKRICNRGSSNFSER